MLEHAGALAALSLRLSETHSPSLARDSTRNFWGYGFSAARFASGVLLQFYRAISVFLPEIMSPSPARVSVADQAPAGCPLSPPLQGSDASTLSVGLNTPC